VIGDVVIWQGWWGNVVVWQRWRGWVVEVLLPLIQWWILSLLLLAEDANSILQFFLSRLLPIDVLPLSFSTLSDFLSSHDGLLLLSKPLYFLLDPDQLILVDLGFLFFCFVPILDLDLVELGFALVDLRRRWKWVGIEVLVTSVALVGNYCGGGHIGMLQLNFWDVVEGQMLCSFSDDWEGLSGWLLECGLVLVGGLW
jgi:hypothetical protein